MVIVRVMVNSHSVKKDITIIIIIKIIIIRSNRHREGICLSNLINYLNLIINLNHLEIIISHLIILIIHLYPLVSHRLYHNLSNYLYNNLNDLHLINLYLNLHLMLI